ncbi:hypothetical protein [Burkholderia sp.]|uniref:DUF7167 family protein n=1 Tax=Burkholderia sp. TaxID=36773 RepID=UPI0025B9A4A0|nr:hypothetical protein [Burkholderia sp.]MBS6362130.1 hypothetical protein [Burkholderia sp.]
MSGKIKVRIWAMTNRVGSKSHRTVEVDREDWESLSDLEKDSALQDEIWNLIEWGWEEQT